MRLLLSMKIIQISDTCPVVLFLVVLYRANVINIGTRTISNIIHGEPDNGRPEPSAYQDDGVF